MKVNRLLSSAFACGLLLLAPCSLPAFASPQDTDHDGLSDAFEAALLHRFEPRFMIDSHDCSGEPALFAPQSAIARPVREDGTIYAQAFPRSFTAGKRSDTEIELHFYHLWRTDCGRMGHPLDAEHVSALLSGNGTNVKDWHAIYWYAAAHEDTVCDASQITRASTLHAEDRGATVWISQGKHASFLEEQLCRRGCGGDRCKDPRSMPIASLINLGELKAAMNGALWANSPRWPLAEKMGRTDFTPTRTARLDALPRTDIAWANPALRPQEAAIAGGNAAIDGSILGGSSTSNALALSNRRTDTALVVAGNDTGNFLSGATRSTGSALGKSYRNVRKALGSAATQTGDALGDSDAHRSPQ
jgi:hypothetical protein